MIGVKGLVSVTFRGKSPEEIIRLSASSGLQGIEWGADVHAPPLDLENARKIGQATRDAGLENVSYGSYYRAGSEENVCTHEQLVAAAEALGTGNIRIWAGVNGSEQTSPEKFQRIVEDTQRLAGVCAESGLTLSFEYHPNTLTDEPDSAVRLMKAVDCDNVRIYWQPVPSLTVEQNCRALRAVLPWLTHAHVFQWNWAKGEPLPDRRPLAEGAEDWRQYCALLREDAQIHNMQLEFVRDDSAEAFCSDAKEFLSW